MKRNAMQERAALLIKKRRSASPLAGMHAFARCQALARAVKADETRLFALPMLY